MPKVAALRDPVRQALLRKVKAQHPDAFIDQWLHIKWSTGGRDYRMKFQTNTVRREVKAPHGWVRLDTYRISHLAEKLL